MTIAERQSATVPLVVDLDETLVSTDTLHESALAMVRRDPRLALSLLIWITRGRSFLKARIAQHVVLQADTLPYRRELVDFLWAERAAGRKVVLATATHRSVAEAVANHLDLFDEVLASDETVNLKDGAKRDALTRRFGLRGFDYIGDSRADVKIWQASRIAHLAGPKRRLMRLAEAAGATPGRSFANRRPGLGAWLRAIRVRQWVKNVLIFTPMVLAHRFEPHLLGVLIATFLAFSAMASGTYLINDLLDLAADRDHPVKRMRPLASGEVPIAQGLALAVLLLGIGIGAAAWLGPKVLACFLAYLALTLAYSACLKQKPMLDVAVLAFLYTLRLIVGGVAGGVYLSPWLFQFSIFLFLSLAFVKRFSELHRALHRNKDARARSYRQVDLSTIGQAGIASGLLAALVLAMYVNSPDVTSLYPRQYALWGTCPLFVYWISRIWLIARRGNMDEDPILFAFRDRVSYWVAGAMLPLILLASFHT